MFWNRKMKRIYIIRHGMRLDHENRSWKNTAERKFDPPLSEKGEREAKLTAQALLGLETEISALYASPLLRTIQTAQHLSTVLDLPIQLEGGIAEWLNPKWYDFSAGMVPPADLKERYPGLNLEHTALVTPSYPEHSEDICHARCEYVARHLSAAQPDGKHIVLVTHGVCVNALALTLVGSKAGVNSQTCAITVLEQTS